MNVLARPSTSELVIWSGQWWKARWPFIGNWATSPVDNYWYWATTLVLENYRYWTTTLVLGNYWYWNKSNCRYQWATIPLLGNYTGEQQPSPPLTLFYTGGQLHHWATTLVGNYTGTRATIDTNVGNYTGKQQPLPPLKLFLFHWQEKLIEEPFSCPNPTIGIDQLPFLSDFIQINF